MPNIILSVVDTDVIAVLAKRYSGDFSKYPISSNSSDCYWCRT